MKVSSKKTGMRMNKYKKTSKTLPCIFLFFFELCFFFFHFFNSKKAGGAGEKEDSTKKNRNEV